MGKCRHVYCTLVARCSPYRAVGGDVGLVGWRSCGLVLMGVHNNHLHCKTS